MKSERPTKASSNLRLAQGLHAFWNRKGGKRAKYKERNPQLEEKRVGGRGGELGIFCVQKKLSATSLRSASTSASSLALQTNPLRGHPSRQFSFGCSTNPTSL